MRDPCINKHGGDAESAAAWQRVKKNLGIQQALVLDLIAQSGEDGLTSHECAGRMGWAGAPHRVSGRFTELKKAGWITVAGRRLTPTGCSSRAYKLTDNGGRALGRKHV